MTDHDRPSGVSRGWIAAVTAAGALVTASALWVEDRWRWEGVAKDILANGGTAILLAAVLFLVERRFTKQIRRTDEVVRQAEGRAEERARLLETRLEDLEAQTRDHVRGMDRESDTAVAALGAVSFATATEALAAANRLRALAYGRARVRAGDEAAALWLTFSWGRNTRDGNDAPRLAVRAALEPRDDETGTPVVEVEWPPDASAPEVGAALVADIRSAGRWVGDGTMRWGVALENLRRTLDVAVRSRRHEEGAWHLHGPVVELVGSDWALTEGGVEAPEHDFLMPPDAFPGWAISGPGVAGISPGPRDWQPPEPPEWAHPAEWNYLMGRGRQVFPLAPAALRMMDTWVPEVGEAQ